jgi:hypothetical protein
MQAGSLLSFSTNDWRMVQNVVRTGATFDYLNNGRAHMYLQDGVAGGHAWFTAPSGTAGNAITFTQAMTLNASGNLGIGTTSIPHRISVFGTDTSTSTISITRASDDAASSYFNFKRARGTTQGSVTATVAGDIHGGVLWQAANGANINTISGFLDIIQETSTVSSGAMRFGAGGNTERARIDSSGNLLVGTTSADPITADVNGTQFSTVNSRLSSNGTALSINRRSTDGNTMAFLRGGTAVGSISVTGSATTYATSSDYRLKNIAGPITNSGAYIDSLNPVEGTWKADGSTFVGLIAHEVQEVSRTPVATGTKDGEEMQGMDYSSAEIIANLIAEVKSLRARLAAANI